MKKNLSFIALLGMSVFAKAQITGPWPYAPLSSQYAYFGNPNTTLPQTAVGNYALLQHNGEGHTFLNAPTGANIYFRINNNDKMFLRTDGNFGIGTIDPKAQLDVKGTGVFRDQVISIGAQTGLPNERVFLTYDGNVAFGRLMGQTGVALSFGANNTKDNLVVYQNGNVGMGSPIANGTPQPSARLQIDNINGTGILLKTNTSSGVPESPVSRKIAWANYLGAEAGSIDLLDMSYHTVGTRMVFSTKNNAGSLQQAMIIDMNGNVGIGGVKINTSGGEIVNPNNYKLAVNGTIGARAVKVEVSQTSCWPDYVFEKDYKMKTITELETFIKTNKHLPNVPSADEVKKDGIDMATMNATLLEKVEELSLYIIEQNKKLEAQLAKMEVQNSRIEALEKN